jgi:hypothetical protein
MSTSIGNAGEHLVMAELLARGFDAYCADRGKVPYVSRGDRTPKTMGIVVVASLAANAEVDPPVAAITATCRRTKSAANSGNRST